MRLGRNAYGKAEIHLVHLDREADAHQVTDLTVSVELEGDFEAAHVEGDNSRVVATDSQKNLVYGLARTELPCPPESFALRVATQLVSAYDSVTRARVEVVQAPWLSLPADDGACPTAFERDGRRRVAAAIAGPDGERHVLGGLAGLALLKSSDSAFRGFLRDRWTTLPETGDRILASSVHARWRYTDPGGDFDAQHSGATTALVEAFASHRSESLQQTLYAMGEAVLRACPGIAEVRLSLPNLHHLLVDLSYAGLDNPNVVFHADDRPYGLIEGTVLRTDATPAGSAWQGPLLP